MVGSRRLNIFMNDFLIGMLEKTKSGGLVFTYDKEWLNLSDARPLSLSMPLVEKPFVGDLVYNFFDNLLPDNNSLRVRIQQQYKIPTNHPFDLLKVIGQDCVGAIQILENEPRKSIKEINFEKLSETDIANVLKNIDRNPLGMNEKFNDFRISIAGAQEKTALLFWNGKWNRPLGVTPTTHIFKLPMGYIQHQGIDLSESCENEWLCSKIATEFGFKVASCELAQFENSKVLIVERFDRKLSSDKTWIMRLPQEDMCQALGFSSNIKYQSDGGPGIKEIMNLLLHSEYAELDRENFFRTQILFWLLAAIDGHAKNFSIHISAAGKYHLTPLYDILSAYPLLSNKQLQARKIKMAMALRGKSNHYHWYDLKTRYFLQTAKFSGYSVTIAENILQEILEKVESVITKVSKEIPNSFPKKISDSIFEGMLLAKSKLT